MTPLVIAALTVCFLATTPLCRRHLSLTLLRAQQVTSLTSANEEMKREMATLRFLLAIVLAVVSVLLLLVLWRTHNLGSICDAGR